MHSFRIKKKIFDYGSDVIFLSLRKHKLAGKLSMFRTRSSKPFRTRSAAKPFHTRSSKLFRTRSSPVYICGGRCDDITIVYFAL